MFGRKLAIGVALALMVVHPVEAHRADIRLAPTAAGNMRAGQAVLRQTDLATLHLGAGIHWKGGRVKAEFIGKSTCPDVPTPTFSATVIGLAKTNFESDDYQLTTQAELYATAAMARTSIRTPTRGRQALACVRDSISRSSAKSRVISVARLKNPMIGDVSVAFRVEYRDGRGPHRHYVVYIVQAVRGRLQTGVVAVTYASGSASLRAPAIVLVRGLIAHAKP